MHKPSPTPAPAIAPETPAELSAVPVPQNAEPPAQPVPSAKPGRPTKLTPALRTELLEDLHRGMNYSQACADIGINRDTLRAWRKTNPSLCTAIAQAEARAIRKRIDIIDQASPTNWRAAAWLLERMCPEVWGKTKSLTVARKLEYAYRDRSPAHETELTPTEIDLRTALYLAPDASEQEVQHALERAKINLMRSRAYGIPVDELPK